MEVVEIPIETVKPYEQNPRHNTQSIEKVAASIEQFGWRQPIVVDEAMTVIVGHTRLAAAQSLGYAKVPVHIAKGMPPQAVKAYRLADNRLAEDATWDMGLLSLEVSDLKAADFDLDVLGFNEAEMMAIMDDGEELNHEREWAGMPEFKQEDKSAYRTMAVHFKDEDAVQEFAELVGHKITPKTKYMWYPEIEIESVKDIAYGSES